MDIEIMTRGQIYAELQEWKKIPAEALCDEAYERMYALQAALERIDEENRRSQS